MGNTGNIRVRWVRRDTTVREIDGLHVGDMILDSPFVCRNELPLETKSVKEPLEMDLAVLVKLNTAS